MSRKSMMPPPKFPASRKTTLSKNRVDESEMLQSNGVPTFHRKLSRFNSTTVESDDCSDEELDWNCTYNRMLQTFMMESLLDEAIEKDKINVQIGLNDLSNEMQSNMVLLDCTLSRLNDINVLSEHQIALNKKKEDNEKISKLFQETNIVKELEKHTTQQKSLLDTIETENVKLGYDKETGFKQLNDSLTDALDILKSGQIHSNVTPSTVAELDYSNTLLSGIAEKVNELETLKGAIDALVPQIQEKVIIECSEILNGEINEKLQIDN